MLSNMQIGKVYFKKYRLKSKFCEKECCQKDKKTNVTIKNKFMNVRVNQYIRKYNNLRNRV